MEEKGRERKFCPSQILKASAVLNIYQNLRLQTLDDVAVATDDMVATRRTGLCRSDVQCR